MDGVVRVRGFRAYELGGERHVQVFDLGTAELDGEPHVLVEVVDGRDPRGEINVSVRGKVRLVSLGVDVPRRGGQARFCLGQRVGGEPDVRGCGRRCPRPPRRAGQ